MIIKETQELEKLCSFSSLCQFEKVQVLFICYFRIRLSRHLKAITTQNNFLCIFIVVLPLSELHRIAGSYADGLRNTVLLNPFNTFAIAIIISSHFMDGGRGLWTVAKW